MDSNDGNDGNQNFHPWIRVNLAAYIFIKKGLLCFFHNAFEDPSYTGLPSDPDELYSHMEGFKNDNQEKLTKSKVLFKKDWDKLCPSSVKKSNSNEWDITLIMKVIKNSSQLPAPRNGWFKKLLKSDNSKAGYTIRALQLRNEIKHLSSSQISTKLQFQSLWKRLKAIVKVLLNKSPEDVKKFEELETCSLEKYGPKASDVVAQCILEESGETRNASNQNLLENLKEIQEVVEGLKQQCLILLKDVFGKKLCNGLSLYNSSLKELEAPNFNVRSSVGMENYTRWPLVFRLCKITYGSMNVAPRTVQPGTLEGFAMHKQGYSPYGCTVTCTFCVNGGMFIHIMIYQPHNLSRKSNRLAICINTSEEIDPEVMLSKDFWKKSCNGTKKVLASNFGLSIIGRQGDAPKSQCRIKVYPRSFEHLFTTQRTNSGDKVLGPDTYEAYLKQKFKTEDGNMLEEMTTSFENGIPAACLHCVSGTSLQNTSLQKLHTRSAGVSCVGTIENYTKWHLIHCETDVKRGYLNSPFLDIEPGEFEVFASYSCRLEMTGSFVKATYSIDNNGNFIHLMFSLPRYFTTDVNSICIKTSKEGHQQITAGDMLKNVNCKKFYVDITPICHRGEKEGVCVEGSIGTSHVTEIVFKVYPLAFKNLAPSLKKNLERGPHPKESYDQFLESL